MHQIENLTRINNEWSRFDLLSMNDHEIHVPERLFHEIQKRLQKESLRRLKYRAMLFFAGIVLSVVALIPLAFLLEETLVDSGFIPLFSLSFTDAAAVLANANTYLFSLLETVPVTSLLIVFCVLLLFFQSLQLFLKNLHSLRSMRTTSSYV